jgi:hypothetical protein
MVWCLGKGTISPFILVCGSRKLKKKKMEASSLKSEYYGT